MCFFNTFELKSMKICQYLLLAFISVQFCFSQEEIKEKTIENNTKSNPIAFAEVFLGYSGVNFEGLSFGYSGNYQTGNNLFTYRNLYIAGKNKNRDKGLSDAFLFPAFINGSSLNEYSLLYGKRLVYDASSLSISVGVSTNTLVYRYKIDGVKYREKENYIGVPFEINYKFFKNKKKRFRVLYGIIPIGKPTAFARSFGFKLYGNFGKVSHVGLGLNYSFGWHKVYD